MATKEAINPVTTIAKTLRLPTTSFVPKLQLPMKLISGRSMLGLGDMVSGELLKKAFIN